MSKDFKIPFEALTRPKMFYHNWSHITRMINDAHRLFPAVADSLHLNAAIFWHDAVYNVGAPAGHNERDSAISFINEHKGDLSMYSLGIVHDLIIATAHHFDGTVYDDNLTNIILDLDIMTFAYPYEEFKAINRLIASENLIPGRTTEDVVRGTINFLDSIALPNLKFRLVEGKEILINDAVKNIHHYLNEMETELKKSEPNLLKFFAV